MDDDVFVHQVTFVHRSNRVLFRFGAECALVECPEFMDLIHKNPDLVLPDYPGDLQGFLAYLKGGSLQINEENYIFYAIVSKCLKLKALTHLIYSSLDLLFNKQLFTPLVENLVFYDLEREFEVQSIAENKSYVYCVPAIHMSKQLLREILTYTCAKRVNVQDYYDYLIKGIAENQDYDDLICFLPRSEISRALPFLKSVDNVPLSVLYAKRPTDKKMTEIVSSFKSLFNDCGILKTLKSLGMNYKDVFEVKLQMRLNNYYLDLPVSRMINFGKIPVEYTVKKGSMIITDLDFFFSGFVGTFSYTIQARNLNGHRFPIKEEENVKIDAFNPNTYSVSISGYFSPITSIVIQVYNIDTSYLSPATPLFIDFFGVVLGEEGA